MLAKTLISRLTAAALVSQQPDEKVELVDKGGLLAFQVLFVCGLEKRGHSRKDQVENDVEDLVGGYAGELVSRPD